MIIALDGPAASGKGILGRRLAEKYGLVHMDTGLLYRAIGEALLCKGTNPQDETEVLRTVHRIRGALETDLSLLDNQALRKQSVGEIASQIAGYPNVRSALLELQRHFAMHPRGAILDGRDIGTEVCPEADVKIFVTAEPRIRAHRRYLDLIAQGENVHFEDVLDGILKRDERDSSRALSPLYPAADAFLLDTTKKDIDEAFRMAVSLVERAIGSPS